MVEIEYQKIDSRVVVRFKREYMSSALERSYMANELIVIVPEAHLEDIQADFGLYSNLPEVEQRKFIERLRLLPHYTGRILEKKDAA
ncbi:hypothetical protein [Noviherbaspirillum malthae]|uniref:hypothetical protein n=1 Tax=Noviherbaspirillum malthae TaxID=1260987 RepID=UPI00188FFC7E|nr:hypothetical protein [Noviherbaspirillum malthae]